MQNFSKNKGFYLTIIILGSVFLAGIVFCYFANDERIKAEANLKTNLKKYQTLLNGAPLAEGAPAVSLTSANVATAKKDFDALTKQRDDLRLAISAISANRFVGRENLASSDLASSIKQNVDEWTKLAADKDIRMMQNEKCEFGFRRYIRSTSTGPKGPTLPKIDQQLQIIDFLYKTLVDSRPNTPNRSPILLQSIDREPIETYEVIPAGKPNAGSFGPVDGARGENDEFSPSRTFRNPPLVDGLSFRLRFIATTPTLRTFINNIRKSGRPLVVTSIDITNPQPEALKLLGTSPMTNLGVAPSGAPEAPDQLLTGNSSLGPTSSPATPAKEERKVVVHQNFSEITLQIDYLFAPEDKPAPDAEPKK